MVDKTDDIKVYCGGEPHQISFSEIRVNENGDTVHGSHYFPSGIPIKGIEDPGWSPYEMIDVLANGLPSTLRQNLKSALSANDAREGNQSLESILSRPFTIQREDDHE